MRKNRISTPLAGTLCAFFCLFCAFIGPASASDHQDGPRVLASPVLDITDLFAFPSPERSGRLVLVMNTLPLAEESAWFSEDLDYSFVLRRISVGGSGDEASFVLDDKEFRFTCNFDKPKGRWFAWGPFAEGGKLVQRGTCEGPDGISLPLSVNDEEGGGSGLRVFAGLRADPFFLNIKRLTEGEIGPTAGAENSLEDKNVLSIVIEVDIQKVLGSGEGSLFAVAGEVYTSGKLPIRLDRQGRSEMTNITLKPKKFDQVNRDLEIRDLYNQEDSFNLSGAYVGAYRARYDANLAFWDQLDGKIDWPLDEGRHPLTELLLGDYLIVDPSKPCTGKTFLEIEKAVLNDRPHETCGGRMPNEDTIDSLLTFYINRDTGARVGDGVDKTSRPAGDAFPYLAVPAASETAKE